ncbi:MAG: ABC transporter ATP-binding protein [Gemmatimonadetes bacterium]|nr:ABC transporter ATP-binding protein [Gemmatimonadota bacterium]
MNAIRIENLRKTFGTFPALEGVSLEVERGELYGFLGPNGAGKTTTIRILTGLLLPTGGSVAVAGFDVVEEPLEVKRRVGYVPDRAFLYEKLTGREFLEFVGHLYGMDPRAVRREADPLLERFELLRWAEEMVEAYSHGMRQKLAMTASLLHRPEVVIIDEPMVGLDPRSAKRMKQLFLEMVDRGQTVFLSTHTLEVAEALCSRVAIIRRGSIVAQGTIDELRRQARHDDGSLEAVFLRLTEESDETPPPPLLEEGDEGPDLRIVRGGP